MVVWSKWIAGISPNTPVELAAIRSLEVRLAGVCHFLLCAASEGLEEPEHVHQLRVCSRRALAAVELYSAILPRRYVKWFEKCLRRIRRAAGKARDLDVIAHRHAQDRGSAARRFLERIQRRRRKVQQPIIALGETCRDFKQQSNRLLAKIESPKNNACDFAAWAMAKLKPLARQFFKRQPADPRDLVALHRFRICAKELRYGMELLAPAFPAEFRVELYATIERLQDLLGSINDHAVAITRLERWTRKSRGGKKSHLVQVLEREKFGLQMAIKRFETSWTSDAAAKTQAAFRKFLRLRRGAVCQLGRGHEPRGTDAPI